MNLQGDLKDSPVHDAFAGEVANELCGDNIKILTGHVVAGITMDLCVIVGQKCLGIDLIGFPGDFQQCYSLDRYLMFNRAGLQIFPLPYARWVKEKAACLDAIRKRIVDSDNVDEMLN